MAWHKKTIIRFKTTVYLIDGRVVTTADRGQLNELLLLK